MKIKILEVLNESYDGSYGGHTPVISVTAERMVFFWKKYEKWKLWDTPHGYVKAGDVVTGTKDFCTHYLNNSVKVPNAK